MRRRGDCVVDGRKRMAARAARLLSLASIVLANSEDETGREGGKGNPYDGVGVEALPRPQQVDRRPKPCLVRTMSSLLVGPVGDAQSCYDRYVRLSDRPFVLPRWTRVTSAVKRELAQVARRYGRKSINELFVTGPRMDVLEYRDHLETISQIGGAKDPRLRFQYDKTDPLIGNRYEGEWDDVNLVVWGPVTVTDSGHFDFDVDLADLSRLWRINLEEIEVAPPPPCENPPLQIGERVRFRTDFKLRISSSRIARAVAFKSTDLWTQKLLNAARYAKASLGVDLYTDIRRRRYLGSDVEFRAYPDGQWAAFLNIVLIGR